MSALDDNKAVIRRYREIHNSGNLDALDAIVAKDVISHNALTGLPPGLEGGKMAHQAFLASAPDLKTRTDHMVAEGDMVVEWYTATGTNTGSFMGMPPTGKPWEITSVVLYRIANGKIVETWGLNDQLGLMQQLGMIPQSNVKLQGKNALQVMKLMEALEDHDDVQNVWANFDIEEKEIEAAMAAG